MDVVGASQMNNLAPVVYGLTCDAVCSAVLPCVAILRLLECLQICSKIPDQLDKSHLKHLAVVFSLSNDSTQNVQATSANIFTTSSLQRKAEKIEKAITCGEMTTPGIMSMKNHGTVGESTDYRCLFGFEFCEKTGHYPRITCQPNGQWSDPPVPCHQKRWDRFVRGQSVYLRFTCSVKTNANIYIRTIVPKSSISHEEGLVKVIHLLMTQTPINSFDVSLNGSPGMLVHHFTLKLENVMHVKFMNITNTWQRLTKDLLFKTRSNRKFDVCLKHLGSSIKVRLNGKQLVVYNIPENFDITRLLVSGDIHVQVVSLTLT